MSRRLFLVPRWAGKVDGDFYNELAALASACNFSLVTLMPKSGLNPPNLEECFRMLDEQAKDLTSEDVFMGHSVGNQIILRWLSQLEHGPVSRIKLISVAGWFDVDKAKQWPSLMPFLEQTDLLVKARQRLRSVHLIISDNDQFTSDWKANLAHWNKLFGPNLLSTIVIKGAAHFNRSSEPELFSRLEFLLKQPKSLFEQLPVGSHNLHHRIGLAPLTNCQSNDDGTLSDEEYVWLTMRAKGNFSMVMTTATFVHPSGKAFPGQLGIYDDVHIDGLARLAKGIKAQNEASISIVQLHHGGVKATFADPKIGPVTAAGADAVVAMTTDQVHEAIAWFVEAAVRAEKAGWSGVELHGAHGYLLTSFFATNNNRGDQFGGSFENRVRIIFEILRGIRRRCKGNFIVGVRLSCERFGLDTSEMVALAQALCNETDGRVDFIDLSLWDVFKMPEQAELQYTTLTNHFLNIDRRHVRIGVCGKVIGSESAQEALNLGADFVLIGRSAVVHHNMPVLMQKDSAFLRRLPAVDEQLMQNEGVSPKFITYLHKNFHESLFSPPKL